MNVEELEIRFEEKANENSDIKLFVPDDLSAINLNKNKSYPLVLFKPPNSAISPFMENTNEGKYENYVIKFYIFNLWTKEMKETKKLRASYREIERIAELYLQSVLVAGQSTSSKGYEYSLIGDKSVVKERGHHQHIDQLVGVSYEFTLRVYDNLC